MKPNSLIGFDFGLKRIGVAIGQAITKTARPLQTLAADKGQPNWQQLAQLIDEWQPDALVVGVPLNMDDTDTHISNNARQFCQQLTKRFGLPVYQVDERLSTKAARQEIFDLGGYKALSKAEVDSVAAVLILETWFSSHQADSK